MKHPINARVAWKTTWQILLYIVRAAASLTPLVLAMVTENPIWIWVNIAALVICCLVGLWQERYEANLKEVQK